MLVKVYNKAGDFLHEHEKIMLEREAESQLILYNAYTKKNVESSERNLFGVVTSDEGPELLFCNVAPHHLIVFPTKAGDYIFDETIERATRILAKYLIEEKIPVLGINSSYEICQGFISYYKANSSFTFQQRLIMDIMKLENLTEIELHEGTTRLGKEKDKFIITDWLIEFDIETFSSETNYEDAASLTKKLIDEKSIYVFENEEGNIVSMAATMRRLKNGVAVSRIFTPKEFRGKGYALTNLHNICGIILGSGKTFITLFADKKHANTIGFFKSIGFNPIIQQFEYNILNLEK